MLLGDSGHFLLVKLSEALSEIFVGSGGTPDEFAAATHYEVDADHHGVGELRDLQTIEIKFDLGVHLLKQV